MLQVIGCPEMIDYLAFLLSPLFPFHFSPLRSVAKTLDGAYMLSLMYGFLVVLSGTGVSKVR